MKLFTSLTAGAAFAQAQDFPGFGGSLADLLAQLNIENQLDLGIGAQAGNDAVVNATDGEFDPITGERYLIANVPDEDDPFTNDCSGNVANTAAEHCNPCVFDPSVCNGDQTVCVATQDGTANGVPLGIHDNGTPGDTSDDWWKYTCECDNHSDPQHRTDPGDDWAGPDCQCTRCSPHDGSTDENSGEIAACSADDPCTEFNDANQTNNIDMLLADPNNSGLSDVCSESPGTNDYQCACDDGFYGETCESTLPCGTATGQPTSECNGATGTNDTTSDPLNPVCVCDPTCASQPENLDVNSPTDIWGGTNCDQSICDRSPVACENGQGTLFNDLSNLAGAECTCQCGVNYSGADCGTDDCAGTNCNGGTLNRSVQGQCTCDCPAGFTGTNCEIPLETPTGTGCWKCDAMTYVQCATEGTFQTCSDDNTRGDNGVCFVEYREQNQKLTQLCTGCKDAKSCDNLKRQNFVPGFEAGNTAPFMRMRNQCKPDYRLQVARRRYGNTQSVCRQCFSMCSNADATSAKTCFGGLGNKLVFTATATDDDKINAAQWIRYYQDIVGGPQTSSSPWNGGNGGTTDKLLRLGDITNNEAIVLGIPLHLTADNGNTQTVVDSPLNHIFRGYLKSDLQNLITTQSNGGLVDGEPTDTTNPLYWTLADSTDFFWSNDLILDQGVYAAADDSTDVFANNGYDTSKPCELDYGAGNYCDRS